jgi:hypothetical protein
MSPPGGTMAEHPPPPLHDRHRARSYGCPRPLAQRPAPNAIALETDRPNGSYAAGPAQCAQARMTSA